MVADLIRDAPFGQVVRFITKNRVFLYPEEKADFKCPHDYDRDQAPVNEKVLEAQLDVQTHPQTPDRLEEGNSAMLDRTQSRPIAPTRTPDGRILADWYDTEDPANPQACLLAPIFNWSQLKKAWTATIICLYTFVVYASSSIYISSVELVMQRFGVGYFKAELGLALYVLGYGIGPLIFSPLSEVPAFGRNAPYITTFALFTILSLPTALVDNLGGLLVLRFLLGFFGSPCLASGGASMGDMYSLLYLPYAVAAWVSFAFAAPGLGPLLSGFAVYAKNWRWSQWEVLWMAGPLFLVFFFFVPETQPMTILHYRAARLRRVTGNEKIRTQVEMDRAGITLGSTVKEAIIKPIEITIKDPAILFVNVYTALMYGIYYSFFEVFPLVFPVYYGMNVGETGIVFVCIVVGCIIAMCIYFAYIQFLIIPDILKNGLRAQEFRLIPALFFCFGPTIGLFLFAWTARPSIHWIVCVIGITIYALSAYIIMQCIFTYIPMSYPRYAASLFAGNDFFRSLFAFGAVLFSRPMFVYLGVGKGCSLLGGLSVTGIVGMYLLYWYGARLRARSRFAVSG
ncbi:major facilitator superfamily transporter [Aaosphaeria arxii CBS 175.79]|uniref:Major facilitator superfamily transporter n=1 Tax=Aaosphaeria arxii CBS 175.79 TaxID=1450172 RepID=A0A6A5Y9M4_9PLEO|nr:major facilitator superfamily transporter [Aaosphaeria arxii CBS 175.79]KAF2022039.1 major facilitator superfamily transporter [Aaosphaeria arxii CBS 175.79]